MKYLIVIGIILLVGAGVLYLNQSNSLSIFTPPSRPTTTPFDPLNIVYTIDEEPIPLHNGTYESTSSESAAKDIVSIFGEPTSGDLNRDGKPDAAVMLVENPGGTGTFYYIAAALNTETGPKGTNAIFLGDRIAPQTIEIRGETIVVNYADRKPDEPMAVRPSVGVTKYFVVAEGILRETKNPPPETASVK